MRYLILSLLLGYALLVWVYVSNDLHGQILVMVGVPVAWFAARAFEAYYPVYAAPWRWIVYDDELPEGITFGEEEEEAGQNEEKGLENMEISVNGASISFIEQGREGEEDSGQGFANGEITAGGVSFREEPMEEAVDGMEWQSYYGEDDAVDMSQIQMQDLNPYNEAAQMQELDPDTLDGQSRSEAARDEVVHV